MADKTIGVSEVTAQDLAKVASKNKVSRDMVISKMLTFFQTYGIDPFNYEAPHEEMTKIIKRFDQMFAFLKKQEKSILIPTLTSLVDKGDLVENQEYTRMQVDRHIEMYKQISEETIEPLKELIGALGVVARHQKLESKAAEEKRLETISDVSKMLQEVTKTIGLSGQKNKVTLDELKKYER